MKIWDFLFMPGRKVPNPSLLRSHPYTEKRIERLAELSAENGTFPYPRREAGGPADRFQAIESRPKWRIGGIWR
jgi:heat shock protein HtpX